MLSGATLWSVTKIRVKSAATSVMELPPVWATGSTAQKILENEEKEKSSPDSRKTFRSSEGCCCSFARLVQILQSNSWPLRKPGGGGQNDSCSILAPFRRITSCSVKIQAALSVIFLDVKAGSTRHFNHTAGADTSLPARNHGNPYVKTDRGIWRDKDGKEQAVSCSFVFAHTADTDALPLLISSFSSFLCKSSRKQAAGLSDSGDLCLKMLL